MCRFLYQSNAIVWFVFVPISSCFPSVLLFFNLEELVKSGNFGFLSLFQILMKLLTSARLTARGRDVQI